MFAIIVKSSFNYFSQFLRQHQSAWRLTRRRWNRMSNSDGINFWIGWPHFCVSWKLLLGRWRSLVSPICESVLVTLCNHILFYSGRKCVIFTPSRTCKPFFRTKQTFSTDTPAVTFIRGPHESADIKPVIDKLWKLCASSLALSLFQIVCLKYLMKLK